MTIRGQFLKIYIKFTTDLKIISSLISSWKLAPVMKNIHVPIKTDKTICTGKGFISGRDSLERSPCHIFDL